MKHTFFSRLALPILLLVAFLVPFSLRGARVAVEGMKNDVKDWLPDDFPETRELDWFRQHFLGDTFVLLTWEGCSEDDPRYKMLVEKLNDEIRISHEFAKIGNSEVADEAKPQTTEVASKQDLSELLAPEKLAEDERLRARKLGNELFLTVSTDMHENWGGLNEKWIHGHKGAWYYITPDGGLYEWNGGSNVVSALKRMARKAWEGKNVATGKLITTFGQAPEDGKPNEYYADPRKVCATLFKSFASGPEAVKQLSRPGGPLLQGDVSEEMAREKAIERLKGSLFGPDGKQTCMILALDPVARRDLKRVAGHGTMGAPLGRLVDIATNQCGLKMDELRMGGPAVDNVAIDEEGQATLINLIGWSALIGLGLSYISFRSFKVTGLVFFTGGISAVTSLAIVYWGFNDSPDAVLMSMPSLVYVLGLAGAVHVINYYRDAVIEGGKYEGAPERALIHSFLPCFLCNFTTALGLISLLTSNITPIRKFGFYSALGVMSTLALLYLFLPAALQLWPIKFKLKSAEERSKESESAYLQNMAIWRPYVLWISHRWAGILTACLLLFFGVGYGCFMIKTDVQLLKMFHKDARIIADYKWMEQNLGKLVPVELVVRVDPSMMRAARTDTAGDPKDLAKEQFQYNFLERMEICDHIQRSLAKVFGKEGADMLGPGLSAATFGPDLPGPSGNWRSVRGTMNRKLEENRDEFLKTDYLRVDRSPEHVGSELWRVSLRLNAMDVDYGAFISDLKRVVEPVLYAYHYRDDVLKSISEQRGGAGFRKNEKFDAARILIIGAANPRAKATAESAAIKKDAGANGTPGAVAVDEKKIFIETLADLLINAGTKTVWLESNAENFAAATEAQKLAAYDCVLLVDDAAPLKPELAKKSAKLFVDAHRHGFIADEVLAKEGVAQTTEAAKRGDPISVIYTGVVPVVYKAQRTLLESLIESFAWTFLTVALTMMVLLRDWHGGWGIGNWLNFRGGFMAMLPNLFPIALVFGVIGWRGILVDIGTMMTASIALGIAVDDTVHFLEWFRTAYMRGLNRVEATLDAFGRVGTAMVQTAFVGGLGLSVFALSSFTPTQRFGTMMLVMLFVALFGELVMMPALLASPLGKYFVPKRCWHRRPKGDQELSDTGLHSAETHLAPGQKELPPPAREEAKPGRELDKKPIPAPHLNENGVRVGSAVRYTRRDNPHK